MNFLDLLLTEPGEKASFYTLEKIEMLIQRTTLDKEEMYNAMSFIEFESEAIDFYNYLKKHQQIPGLHFIPGTLYERKQAINFLVAKDDYQEQRCTTKK